MTITYLNLTSVTKKKKTAADESLREADKMADIIVNQKLKDLPFLINSAQAMDLTNPIKLLRILNAYKINGLLS